LYRIPKYGIYNNKVPMTKHVFYCPAMDLNFYAGTTLFTSYGINNFTAVKAGAGWYTRERVAASKTPFPAKQALLSEANGHAEFSAITVYAKYATYQEAATAGKLTALHFRHNKSIVTCFVDGHVEKRNMRAVPNKETYQNLSDAAVNNTYFVRGELAVGYESITVPGL
jgi:prepilin-type processing-associated H-X9-DG protein